MQCTKGPRCCAAAGWHAEAVGLWRMSVVERSLQAPREDLVRALKPVNGRHNRTGWAAIRRPLLNEATRLATQRAAVPAQFLIASCFFAKNH